MAIKRRDFIGRMLAGAASVIPLGALAKKDKDAASPNVVMIISDDQSWGDYGFMGHKSIATPNLDQLASGSRVFTRGYVVSPLCGPSLASMVTGLYPRQHGKTSNDPHETKGKGQFPPARRKLRNQVIANFQKCPRIPEMLKQKGYLSLQTGKWWMGNYRAGGFTHGMTHGDIDRGGRHGDEGLKIGRENMQPISGFLDGTGRNPFFIWYAPFLPHRPHNPPKRLIDKYRAKTDSIHIARYWANCEWFDDTCGQLLEELDKRGLSDNTMVLYVCDNGWIQRTNNPGYAPRSKRTPYEGGIRTPIMVKWPGHVEPEIDRTHLASSIDLAPTILDACGLKPTASMHGVNLLDSKAVAERKAVFGAAYTHDAVDVDDPVKSLKYAYVISGDWKLIQPSGRNGTGNSPELYHVVADPNEKKNLAAENPRKVKSLQKLLEKWWSESVEE